MSRRRRRAGAFESPGDRAGRISELAGFGVCPALEVAQDDRRAVFLRQAAQLVSDQPPELRSFHLRERVGERMKLFGQPASARSGRAFRLVAERGERGLAPVLPGKVGTAPVPADQRRHRASHPPIETTQFRRPVAQDQKGGLENVLDVVLVMKHAPANMLHERSVAFHQSDERSFFAKTDKSLQQDRVA